MKRAHSRVVLASGGEVAFGEMLVRLPLSPQDHDIVSFCSEVAGWSDELLVRPKAIASPAGSSAGGMGWIAPTSMGWKALSFHRLDSPMFFMGWIAPMCFIFVSWAGKPNFFMGWKALSFDFPSSRWKRVRCTALDPIVGEDLRGGRRCHSMSRFGWPFRAEQVGSCLSLPEQGDGMVLTSTRHPGIDLLDF